MTPIEQFKIGLKDLIVKSIEKCLDCLDLAIDKKATDTANSIRLFKQQLFKLKTHQQKGTMTFKDIDIEMSLLSLRLMTFIDNDLDENVIADATVLMDKTQKEIVVICREMQEDKMREFFTKHYFPKVSFINYGNSLSKKFQGVIILEDMPTCSVPETDMEKYLKEPYPYFLYYGSGFFPRNLQENYDKNKDRVYFANSQFSLYARLKELLDYIKYYGK